MQLRRITYEAIKSTTQSPRWWILALIQAAALFIIGRLARPLFMRPMFFFTLAAAIIVLQPASVWLWLEIEAKKDRQIKKFLLNKFLKNCVSSGVISLCAIAAILFARVVFSNWIFLTIVSSLIAGTSILAMLYAVLCGLNFKNSLALALDTWHKKISLALASALVLTVVHGISFALAHEIKVNFRFDTEFSVLSHSATIWILLALGILIAAFLAAVLNCFLVLLFLEIIQRQKNAEAAERTVLKELALSQAEG